MKAVLDFVVTRSCSLVAVWALVLFPLGRLAVTTYGRCSAARGDVFSANLGVVWQRFMIHFVWCSWRLVALIGRSAQRVLVRACWLGDWFFSVVVVVFLGRIPKEMCIL